MMKELFKVKFNGHTYAGYGNIKSTKNATTEIVEIDEDGVDTISVGKDKWYNRPWYRFQFGNALEDAVIKWFGKQASEKIHRAVNDSRDCQEAMDKFISSLNVRESYKRRAGGALKERKRIAHDMLADGDWVEYSITVFPDANKMGFFAQNGRGKNIAFDTIREAQRYADKNFPDAECIVIRKDESCVSGPMIQRVNGKWRKIDGVYSDINDADLTESYKRRIREGSSYAVGDKMFRLNGINLKDWYTSEYPDDELGYELNDDVDLRRCYSSLGKEPDIYDVMGVGDSIIRERVFAKMADVMGVDYDVIYHKWLDY